MFAKLLPIYCRVCEESNPSIAESFQTIDTGPGIKIIKGRTVERRVPLMDLAAETDIRTHRALVHKQTMKENRVVFLVDRGSLLDGEIRSRGTRKAHISRVGIAILSDKL